MYTHVAQTDDLRVVRHIVREHLGIEKVVAPACCVFEGLDVNVLISTASGLRPRHLDRLVAQEQIWDAKAPNSRQPTSAFCKCGIRFAAIIEN
jgi:hypothetical protein